MENLETKKCGDCKEDKLLTEYYTIRLKSGAMSRPSVCIRCTRLRGSRYYFKNKVAKIPTKIIDLEGEIWKDVANYEGLYKISNKGRLMSCAKSWPLGDNVRQKFDTISPVRVDKDRYHTTTLRRDNKGKTVRVHRLVAQAFISNSESKPEINHINAVKHDNRVENLEWCTRSENQRHAHKLGLNNVPAGFSHSYSKGVFDTETGIFYGSMQECSKAIGVPYSVFKHTVSDKGRGKNTTQFILL